VLRRIFGSNSKEATEYWTKCHNEMLNNLYLLIDRIRGYQKMIMRWMGHVTCSIQGDDNTAYGILFGKPRGKILLERSSHKQKYKY
jgi:hypothetical protein